MASIKIKRNSRQTQGKMHNSDKCWVEVTGPHRSEDVIEISFYLQHPENEKVLFKTVNH